MGEEPDLHVLAGTRRIAPLSARDGRYVFAIPPGEAPLRLVSRSARPCEGRGPGLTIRGLWACWCDG